MQYDDPLKSLLRIVVRDSTLHARWLNTFSFLEYIGFRKIVKSQEAASLSLATLSHAVEEGRHALILKKLALKVGGVEFDNYDNERLLRGPDAEAYFQSLDRACADSFSALLAENVRLRLTYLYVTWLVEVRALGVYELYQSALAEIGQVTSLKGLMAEELGHLSYVERALESADPEFESRRERLQIVEAELYRRYVLALTQEIRPTVTEYAANI